jgi:hypothetical protein
MWLIDFRSWQKDMIDFYLLAGWSLCVFAWRDVADRFPLSQKDLIDPYYSAGRSLCVVTWRDWSISTLGRKIWSIPTIQQEDHYVSWHDVMWLIDFRPGQKDLIDSHHSAGRSLCVVTWRDFQIVCLCWMIFFEWIDTLCGSGATSRRKLYPEVMRPLLILLSFDGKIFFACIEMNCLVGWPILADSAQISTEFVSGGNAAVAYRVVMC